MASVNNTRPAILGALAAGDMTCSELTDELGIRLKTLEYNLRRMRADGLIHICAWQRPLRQGKRAAVYRLGAGLDVRMTRRSAKERAADQASWARHYRLRKRMAAAQANPFGGLILQVAPTLNRGQFGFREARAA